MALVVLAELIKLTREIDCAGHADLEAASEVLEQRGLLVYLCMLDPDLSLALLVLRRVLPGKKHMSGGLSHGKLNAEHVPPRPARQRKKGDNPSLMQRN